MGKITNWTKLDMYDYYVKDSPFTVKDRMVKDETHDVVIVINVDSPSDVLIADIATSLNQTEDFIYLEDKYYKALKVRVMKDKHFEERYPDGSIKHKGYAFGILAQELEGGDEG